MNKEWIDVADAKIPGRHALPACPAVAADAKTRGGFRSAVGCRRGAVKFARIVGWNQHAVRVGVDVVHRRPGFTAVRAAQESADFHRDVNDVGILRMEGDALRMGLMLRARESPLFHARHLTKSRQLCPALAE